MAQGETKPSVLHVNDARTWRGGEQQTLYLARGMAARGLRAELVCRPGSALAQKARESGLVVHEVRMRSELDLPAAWRIARLARRGSFQAGGASAFHILHAHTAHAHALILLARRLFRARCRLVVHRRIEFPVGRRTLGLGRLKYGSGVDAYVAISNGVKESLVAAGIAPWRIFPVRSCTDPERFASAEPDPKLRAELGVPEDAYVVGNVGYLVGHKDHANLLRAAAIARESLPNLWVVIVGPGPLREELLKLAEELGISEHVVLTGFRGDIPQLLLMFDVFALSSSEEGICSSVLDAMASRCPVVGTDAAGVREAVLDGRTGILVPIRDSGALAEAIVRMAREPAEAQRMAEAAGQRVRELFTVEALTDGTLEVYGRVLADEVGPARPVEPAP